MLGGLTLFGIVFALNSSVHSYLVLAYSEADRVSLSVGFYYMANAAGRLIGTLLSGVLYQRPASRRRCGAPWSSRPPLESAPRCCRRSRAPRRGRAATGDD